MEVDFDNYLLLIRNLRENYGIDTIQPTVDPVEKEPSGEDVNIQSDN